MNKQPEVTEQTRARLRAAFWELYRTRPIERISVREITERAGYNRATFYLYYHDVYELLAGIEDEVIAQVHAVASRLLPDEELDFSRHMGFIMQMAASGHEYFSVLIGEHGDPAFARRFKDELRPVLERFLVPGDVSDPREREIICELYLSGIVSAVSLWLSEDEPLPADAFVGLVARALLR